jgi:hypothetical protein
MELKAPASQFLDTPSPSKFLGPQEFSLQIYSTSFGNYLCAPFVPPAITLFPGAFNICSTSHYSKASPFPGLGFNVFRTFSLHACQISN